MKRRSLCALAASVMIISSLSSNVYAFPAENSEIGNLTYASGVSETRARTTMCLKRPCRDTEGRQTNGDHGLF